MKKSAVCIGVFDGVHRGHRRIIQKTVSEARRFRLKPIVLTFDPHPAKVLHPAHEPPKIHSLRHRMVDLMALGIEQVAVIRFTRAFSRTTPDQFVRKILLGRLKAELVCVGEDFRFGRGAGGDIQELRAASKRLGFRLIVVSTIRGKGKRISSTLIRALILKGKLKEAAFYLGRPVNLFGTVVRGKGRGKGLGFPTANLRLHHETIPPAGIYAATALCEGKRYAAAVHIGPIPTFNEKDPVVEAHLLNSHKSFYGKDIELFLHKKLRKILRFKATDQLIRQIRRDVEMTRRLVRLPKH